MLKATLRGLLSRKLRLALSGFAVVLGVAFVSGSYVLTDSLGRVFDNLFSQLGRNTAVVVQGTSLTGSDRDRTPVPQSVLDGVRKVDGVKEAIGGWYTPDGIVVLDRNGKPFTKAGPPAQGTSINATSEQEDLKVVRGRAPARISEVALDPDTARELGYQVGDKVRIGFEGPIREMALVGIVRLGNLDNLAGATLVAVDPTSSQTLLGTPGTWGALQIAAEPGADADRLLADVKKALPKGFEAQSQQEAIDEATSDIKSGLSFFNTFLQVFGYIALFVGMFLIFNTFSMLIAQRTRELALMRALGASRGQVIRAVLLESLIVGIGASLTGFVLGLGVAVSLRAIIKALGADLPEGPTVVQPRTFVVSLILGVVITCLAALLPARRASRIAPVQAMRESGPAEDRRLGRRTAVGSVILLLGIAALLGGLNAGQLLLFGLGAMLCFLGVAVLSPLFARPVVGALGTLVSRLGVPSRLGRGNAMRSPRRTSATAAALMIGLGLVTMVSTAGTSIKASVKKAVATSMSADFVLHTSTFNPFSPEVAEALEGRPGIAAVVPFRVGTVKVAGDSREVQGVDPADLAKVLTLDVQQGSFDNLAKGQLAISEKAAERDDLRVGSTVPVTWSKTGEQTTTVGAVYALNQFAGEYLVSEKTFDANTTRPLLVVIAIQATEDLVTARASIEEGLKTAPTVEVEDRSEFVQAQADQIDVLLTILTALLAFSILIAVLGVVNTLALSVVERTRELGLLRAVGLQRTQLRRMIRVESVLIAVYGAVLGVLIGVAFGAALVNALKDEGITEFAIPFGRIALLLVVAVLAGVLAAVLPARRAARLNVLEAIATA